MALPLVTVTSPSMRAPLAMARILATISPLITALELISSLSSTTILPVTLPASTAWRALMSPSQCADLLTRERAADAAIALHVARHHERALGHDVAHDGGAFGDDGGRHAQSVGQSAFGFFGHGRLRSTCWRLQ